MAQSNAALQWQAGGLGWRIRELGVACPLEGLVRLVAFRPALRVDFFPDRSHRNAMAEQLSRVRALSLERIEALG